MKVVPGYYAVQCLVIPTFESANEILKSEHSNGSYKAVLSCGALYYAVQGCSDILTLWIKP